MTIPLNLPTHWAPRRILLAAYGEHGLRVLQGLTPLRESGQLEWLGAMCWSEANHSWGLHQQRDEIVFRQLIHQHNRVEAIPPTLLNRPAFKTLMAARQPDVVLLATWGEIIKPEVLQAYPNTAFINCHPALLPYHRGANPYTSVIKAGELHSGITYHYITPAVDAGPVLLQKQVLVDPADTGGSLKSRCAMAAKQSIEELLHLLRCPETRQGTMQDAAGSYFPPITTTDGVICWEHSAETIINQVRSLQPWLDCSTRQKIALMGWKPFWVLSHVRLPIQDFWQPVTFVAGQVLANTQHGVVVACGTPTHPEAVEWVEYQLHTAFGFLPMSLSRLMGRRLLTHDVILETV